jgi:hypothetical protein
LPVSFTPKNWQNAPSTSTPLSAAAQVDTETRLAAYSVLVGETQIDAVAEGTPTDGSSDCSPALEAIKASYSGGGLISYPQGTFNFASNHDLTAGQWSITGAAQWATKLQCGANVAGAAFTLRGGAHHYMENLRLSGPDVSPTAGETMPVRNGLELRDQNQARRVLIEGFGEGLRIVGNHQSVYDCKVSNNWYGATWRFGGSGTSGNQTLINVDLTGNLNSSIDVSQGAKIDSSYFGAVHMGFGDYGMTFGARAGAGQEGALSNTVLLGCSFESVNKGFILDGGFGGGAGVRRMITGNTWINTLTPSSLNDATNGVNMIKIGRLLDERFIGARGDAFNSNFGCIGNTAAGCAILFEECRTVYWMDAGQVLAQSRSLGRPVFRIGGAADGLSDVYMHVAAERYFIDKFGATITLGQTVGKNGGDVILTNALMEYFGYAGQNVTSGDYGAVCYRDDNANLASTGAIARGELVMPDTAAPGSVKVWTAGATPFIGRAVNAASGNVVKVELFAPVGRPA